MLAVAVWATIGPPPVGVKSIFKSTLEPSDEGREDSISGLGRSIARCSTSSFGGPWLVAQAVPTDAPRVPLKEGRHFVLLAQGQADLWVETPRTGGF